jgi:hypothetical protein
MKTFTTRCSCGRMTSKKYAREHGGKCKSCVTGVEQPSKGPTREQRIIDIGYDAYAREEGHYSQGDY